MTSARRGPAIELDEARWPLVLITFRGVVPDTEFDAYLDGLERILLRGGPAVAVVDTREAGLLPGAQRRKQAEWYRDRAEALRSTNLGTAFVIDSTAIRGVLTAMLWLAPLPQPYHVAATFEDAERWVLEKLRAGGVPPSTSPQLRTA